MKWLAIAGWLCSLVMSGAWCYVFYLVNTAGQVNLAEPVKWIALVEFAASAFIATLSLVFVIVSILRGKHD